VEPTEFDDVQHYLGALKRAMNSASTHFAGVGIGGAELIMLPRPLLAEDASADYLLTRSERERISQRHKPPEEEAAQGDEREVTVLGSVGTSPVAVDYDEQPEYMFDHADSDSDNGLDYPHMLTSSFAERSPSRTGSKKRRRSSSPSSPTSPSHHSPPQRRSNPHLEHEYGHEYSDRAWAPPVQFFSCPCTILGICHALR
jgi:hypothetical protein